MIKDMKKIYSIILVAGVLLSAVSCASDDALQGTTREGAVKFKIGVEDQLMTRATDSEITADAKVMIYKPEYEGLIREYKYSDMPETIYLPVPKGDLKYRVDVYAGERVKDTPAKASWNSKSYKGSTEFSVKAGDEQESDVNVVANICNVVTQVSFDQSVTDAFESDYGLTVGYDANTLTYAAADSGKDGYFIIADDAEAPEFTWNFVGNLKKDGSEFKSSSKFAVEQGKRYVMKLKYVEKDGTLKFVVQVDDTLSEKDDQIIFEPTSTGISTTKKYDIWATHITLRADVDEAEYDVSKVYFEYRKANTEGTWSSVIATKESEGVYAKVIAGLEPDTEYECRLIVTPNGSDIAADPIAGKNFTTALAQQVPNANFNDISNYESTKYYSFFDPSSNVEENQSKWWDSGNYASSTVISDPNEALTRVDTGYDGTGYSALLHTQTPAANIIAAGNIYSGFMQDYKFELSSLSASGTVCFGKYFAGRPSKMRLMVKYQGASGSATTHLTDGKDQGQIKIALGAWDKATYGKNAKGSVVGTDESPVAVDTSNPSTIIDYAKDATNGGKTYAYGDVVFKADGSAFINGATTAAATCNEWKEITIPIEYYNTTATVTHIIISCAASMYGDYFEGYAGSKMWIDKVELIYDENVAVK